MDLTDFLASVTSATGDVTTVGLAILGVLVVVASFRWIRRSLA